MRSTCPPFGPRRRHPVAGSARACAWAVAALHPESTACASAAAEVRLRSEKVWRPEPDDAVPSRPAHYSVRPLARPTCMPRCLIPRPGRQHWEPPCDEPAGRRKGSSMVGPEGRFIFERYLQADRVSSRPRPTLEFLSEMARAQLTAIPFENLDPLAGERVALDPESLWRKLVVSGRGGYCFELNLLFDEVMRAVGFAPRKLFGRVIMGRAVGVRGRWHPRLELAGQARCACRSTPSTARTASPPSIAGYLANVLFAGAFGRRSGPTYSSRKKSQSILLTS